MSSTEPTSSLSSMQMAMQHFQRLPLTPWAVKIKRYPDGLMQKLKAHFWVCGNLQEDVFNSYAPVYSWTSLHMLTIVAF
jgi:hypothetical protein